MIQNRISRINRISGRYRVGSYPVLLAVFGCVCLTATGSWQVYTEPIERGAAKIWQLAVEGWELPPESGGLAAEEGTQIKDQMSGQNPIEISGQTPENAVGASDGAGREESAPEGGNGGGEAGEDPQTYPREPVYYEVEDSYFADAVFIGDSRTVGLYEYGGLEEISDFYASTGLTVYKLFTDKIVAAPGQKKKITVEEALTQRQFAKIYLMIGINEMGTGTVESFLAKYAECVEQLRELQPDAVICLQSIMRVTQERSEQGDYITNEGIDARNEGIAAMADNEHVFYLDVNQAVCDETDALTADYTHDGVHLKAQYIALWKAYLESHAVTPE
ncbi:MAG: GDSL-type esterase/lipase family protein [Muribaculum sp.]|nr:GDSL-type esterase/lipase family protein [Muribaculum sp.]